MLSVRAFLIAATLSSLYFCPALKAQTAPPLSESTPFSVQVRTITPMESISDTSGNQGGLGIGLGYIVVDKMYQALRVEGLLRLDADRYNGNNGASTKSYTAALQINLYPFKSSKFYILAAPIIQSHQLSPAGLKSTNYAGFGLQGGIGWALSFQNLYSLEVSYLKMDKVDSHNFSSLRYELCFRF